MRPARPSGRSPAPHRHPGLARAARRDPGRPGFGRYFTDHMVRARWTEEQAGTTPSWCPTARSRSTRPRTSSTTASRSSRGSGLPPGRRQHRDVPAARVNAPGSDLRAPHRDGRGARRGSFVGSIEALVRQDRAWVPDGAERSLYLRPFMFSTEVGLGVRPGNAYEYLLIASPAGAYFPRAREAGRGVALHEYVRAARAARVRRSSPATTPPRSSPRREASAHGCDQVVWLDALGAPLGRGDGRHEPHFVYGRGDPRAGHPAHRHAARRRHPRLAPHDRRGPRHPARRRGRISVDDGARATRAARSPEVFACGTAAVITPVGSVKSRGGAWTVADGSAGEVTLKRARRCSTCRPGARPTSTAGCAPSSPLLTHERHDGPAWRSQAGPSSC